MDLASYMEHHGIRDDALAEQLGVGRTAVTRWRLGQRRPEPEMAGKLVELTKGAISLAELRPELAKAIGLARKPARELRESA